MKIVDINVRVFVYKTRNARDRAGHSHPGEETDAEHALLTIVCDDGTEGYSLYQPEVIRPYVIDRLIKPILIGQDPFERERLWQEIALRQRGSAEQLTDRAFTAVELALWDLAGRKLGQPVHKLIGSYRDKAPAYGSTMVGDDVPGGLSSPEDYARFAQALVKRGYKAIKLHTWMPSGARSPDPKRGREGLRRGARGGRPRHRADARRLSLVQPHRRALSRPRAAEARLCLVRGADGGGEHDLLCLARPEPRHPDPRARKSSPGKHYARRMGEERRLRHHAHRRVRRRRHRRRA